MVIVIYSRPEFKLDLHNEACYRLLAILVFQSSEHHAICGVYLTESAKGLKLSSRLHNFRCRF
jgi:hypothetical protein